MKQKAKLKYSAYGTALMASLFTTPSVAATIDPVAEVVMVRKSCTENSTALNNCFTDMNALTGWMRFTRKPNATTPLRVNIGPGLFETFDAEGTRKDISITCDPAAGYTGHTTFEGSGSRQTILKGQGSGNTSALNVRSCTELNFSHLQITTGYYGGVQWKGGGNSNWNDVEILGTARAWYEEGCSTTRGKHYWFASKLASTAAFTVGETYRATCDESWFYGSEITVSIPAPLNYETSVYAAVYATGAGIIHVYGSSLRTYVDGSGSAAAALVGSQTKTGGEIHIHGTGIDLISQTGRDVIALQASNGGVIHADITAYNPRTSGTVTRIANNGGHVHAPYIWQHIPTNIADLVSLDGVDQTVVMVDGYPHTAIYSAQCKIDTNNQAAWYDTVDKVCRDSDN